MNEHSDSLVLQRIDRKVTEISTALFGLPGDKGFMKSTEEDLESHNKRLRTVERWMYTLMGAVIVLAFLVGHNMIALAGK